MTDTDTMPGHGSDLVAALERAWQAIRTQHADIPDAVIVVASGSGGRKGLKLGHFARSRWEVQGESIHEVLIGGEGLSRGARDVLATLLHEAAHGLAAARGIKDTSGEGRVHNKRFARLGQELGLEVAKVGSIGWSGTTVPDATAEAYAETVADLTAALMLWRRAEVTVSKPKDRNNVKAICGCDRVIRVSRKVLAEAPILCGACEKTFEADDDDGQEG